MKFITALNEEPVSTGDVQGIQVPMNGKDSKDKKKKIVRRPIKVKVKKL